MQLKSLMVTSNAYNPNGCLLASFPTVAVISGSGGLTMAQLRYGP